MSQDTKYKNDYNRENYDQFLVTVKRGEKEKIRNHGISKGYKSLNEYIKSLIYQDMGGWRISKKLFIIYLQPSISKCVTVKGDRHAPRNTILPPT